ncbi:MAG: preprotein translocase subunit SecY [Oscillospiraceae bacterium]|nr:preprotein translocase subunit SecY [Oscillospiraceae bacterium]
MFKTLKTAWGIPEIRRKMLFTLFIIVIFRLGSAITVPFLDQEVIRGWMAENATNGNFLEYLNILSGGALQKATIFSLGVTPFINASIIIQLLTYALPPLERLQQEGEDGRKKLNQISSFVAFGLATLMSFAYYLTLKHMGDDGGKSAVKYTTGGQGVLAMFVIMLSFMAGASLVIWLGNRINERGIGNGVSMILFAGIVARIPIDIGTLYTKMRTAPQQWFIIIVIYLLIFVAEIVLIVFFNESERRIPVQYAKRVVGRKQYGGQNTHIPIKVCLSGVMPIIFAMSFMSLPSLFTMFKKPLEGQALIDGSFWERFYAGFVAFFSTRSYAYAAIYFVLIILFNYFYVAISYNPVEMANNLRQSNGGIPGIRPGKPTSDYIQRVLSKISLVGAIFLGIVAVFPIIYLRLTNLTEVSSMGGTSILIVVSVAIETVRTLESQLMMRHHKGFLG